MGYNTYSDYILNYQKLVLQKNFLKKNGGGMTTTIDVVSYLVVFYPFC